MMKRQNSPCSQVQEDLLRLFDEKNLRDPSPDLRAHLDECAACRREWKALLKLDDELQRLPAADPGETYWINFLPRLRRRMERPVAPPRRRDFAWVTAAVIALFFAVWLTRQPTPIAPPSWYSTVMDENCAPAFSLLTTDFSEEERYRNPADSSAADLNSVEMDAVEMKLIDLFSARIGYVSEDPVDQLLNLDEQSIEKLLEALKKRPIIASS